MTNDQQQLLLWMVVMVATYAVAAGVLSLLAREIMNARARRERLDGLKKELDRTVTAFGFGAGPSPLSNVVGGVATSDGPSGMLEAPLSGRPCLAYLVTFGYPLDGDCVEYDHSMSASASRPFLLDGSTLITLDPAFHFSPASNLHRRDLEYEDACRHKPSDPQVACVLDRCRALSKPWTNVRVYEWILPPNEHCEIEAEVETTDAGFRTVGAAQLRSARLYVGVRGSDEAVLDRIRQTRIAANRALTQIAKRRRLVLPLGLVTIGLLLALGWMATEATVEAEGRLRGLDRPTPADQP